MSRITLEIDDKLLARAEEASHNRGGNLQSELMARVEELAQERPSRQLRAVRRLLQEANANPHYLEGGMPDRDERNAR